MDASIELARVLNVALAAPALLKSEIGKRTCKRINGDFDAKCAEFVKYATHFITSGASPSGGYSGIWCRDASFIIEAWIELGMVDQAASLTEHIWSSRISANERRLLVGRGSPKDRFRTRVAKENEITKYAGALPTSMHLGYREIYASSPDIDSTALMIRATCRACTTMKSKALAERLFPSLENAISYLDSRDFDGDLLLEQGPNEDWMDTVMREGKIVYSQGAWLGALRAFASLLGFLGRANEADKITEKTIHLENKVDLLLWNGKCYADNSGSRINQDVVFYINEKESHRGIKESLDALAEKLWIRPIGPCVTSPALERTGPLHLRDFEYHNRGFWPWISSVEVISRTKNGDKEKATILLEKCINHAQYEWIGSKSGKYPFRTGVAATFLALRRFLSEDERFTDSATP